MADKWSVSVWKDQQVLHLDVFADHLIACTVDAVAIIDLESQGKLFSLRDQLFASEQGVALQSVRIAQHDGHIWLVVVGLGAAQRRLCVSLAPWSGRKTCNDDWWHSMQFYLNDFEIGSLDNVTRIHTVPSPATVRSCLKVTVPGFDFRSLVISTPYGCSTFSRVEPPSQREYVETYSVWPAAGIPSTSPPLLQLRKLWSSSCGYFRSRTRVAVLIPSPSDPHLLRARLQERGMWSRSAAPYFERYREDGLVHQGPRRIRPRRIQSGLLGRVGFCHCRPKFSSSSRSRWSSPPPFSLGIGP